MKTKLYRMPKDPGYLGGFYLTPSIVGFLCLLLTNVAATQYIAAHFQYQMALREPLFRFQRIALYEPFAWALWVWHYGQSGEAAVRMPLLFGAFLVVVGAFASGGVFFFLNLRHTKALSRNTEDLHGSAHWATEQDLRNTGLLDAKQGVYVGGWYDEEAHHLHYLRHNGAEHVLAFAPTRQGKGGALVIPSLLAWSESAVIYDIKGEAWSKTAGFRSQAGHICLRFAPVEVEEASHFNPLAEVRIFTPFEVSDAQNVAEMIVTSEAAREPLEPHWQQSGTSLMTGMILHVCYAATKQGRTATLSELSAIYTRPSTDFRETLQELLFYPHDPEREYNWHMPTGEATETHPVVREKAQEMLNKEDRELSGVLSTAKTALTLYCDPLVAKHIVNSDFQIVDLVNHEKPISLYLVVPPAHKKRLRPLVRLIFTMIVNRLTEKLEFHGSRQKHHKHRLLFMIDEFPTLKKMDVFADALSYMGGYGLKAFLITQDIRQIIEEYGVYESIVSNCQVRAAFAPNQFATAELLSKMTGTKTVQKADFTYSGTRGAPMLNHVNESVEQIQRPLLTPDEVLRLLPPKKEGEGEDERIVAPGDMLIFVSGQPPIYGKQMFYFFDEVLRARSEMPPPTRFLNLRSPATPSSNDASPPEEHDSVVVGGHDHEHVPVLRQTRPPQLQKRPGPERQR
jgi:type IV secretion system protein VirD4